MSEAAKYQLTGQRCPIGLSGSVGGAESFETVVIATGYDDAQTIARENWRGRWKVITMKAVRVS